MQPAPSHAVATTANSEYQAVMAGRLKSGDESVLVEILAAFGPAIGGVLGRDCPQLAAYIDDVLAQALYSLWLNRDFYEPTRTPLRRWFFIISQHIAIDLLKSGWQKSRQAEAGGGVADADDVSDDDDTATDELPAKPKSHQDIHDIFNDCSIVDQKILYAHASSEDGESWAADLSGEIGMKAGAIRVRLIRLHKRIEEEMSRRGHNLRRVTRASPRTIPFRNIS